MHEIFTKNDTAFRRYFTLSRIVSKNLSHNQNLSSWINDEISLSHVTRLSKTELVASGAKVRTSKSGRLGIFKSYHGESVLRFRGEGCMMGRMGIERIYRLGRLIRSSPQSRRREKVRTTRQSPFGNDRVSASPPAPSADLANPPADWSAITRGRSTSGPPRHYRGACIPLVLDNRLARRWPDDTRRTSAGTAKWVSIVAWSTYRSRTRWAHRPRWTWRPRTARFRHRRNPNVRTSRRCRVARALTSRPTKTVSTRRSTHHIPPICTWTGWTRRRRWRVPAFSPALAVVTGIC